MKKTKKICWSATAAAAAMLPRAAFAAGTDALSAINNLKNLMLNLLSAVGVVLVIWGIVQVAMGFKRCV